MADMPYYRNIGPQDVEDRPLTAHQRGQSLDAFRQIWDHLRYPVNDKGGPLSPSPAFRASASIDMQLDHRSRQYLIDRIDQYNTLGRLV